MKYRALAVAPLGINASIAARSISASAVLTEASPARDALVDFATSHPLTVSPSQTIDHALAQMIEKQVRTLIVTRGEQVAGLITSYDIEGPKPLQFLHDSACVRPKCQRAGIEVADVMTAVDTLPVLPWEALDEARIGDLLETFHSTRQTHLLVVESRDDKPSGLIRGIISRTYVERLLGSTAALTQLIRAESEMPVFARSAGAVA